jgi:hypothetical protein
VLFTHPDRYDIDFLVDAGYSVEREPLRPLNGSRREFRVVFFATHGESAIDVTQLCRGAGVQIDLGGKKNRMVSANTTPDEQARLTTVGAGAPSDEELERRFRQRWYDAVIVKIDRQIREFYANIRPLDPRVPMIVLHGNNCFEVWKRLGVENFMSASLNALAIMSHCETFHTRKLVNWDWLPSVRTIPSERSGFASYIHAYPRAWPGAWQRFEELNRLLAPESITAYGWGSPGGMTCDVTAMRHARATVHIKDSGICCFAVIRSMAMATPVVVDRLTYDRCFLDGLEGPIVCNGVCEAAEELRRLAADDDYWLMRSTATLAAARRQFSCDEELAGRFREFLHRVAAKSHPPQH